MPEHQKSLSLKFSAALLDFMILVLAVIWLKGGIQWQGREILRHGADLRRAALILAITAAYAWPAIRRRSVWLKVSAWVWLKLQTPRGRWTGLSLGFVLASILGVLQALALQVPLYDVGLFHQIGWSLAHGHGFVSTVSGAGNFLVDHLAPSLAIFTPVFWLTGSSPLTLQIVFPFLIYLGISAWVWFAALHSAALAAATLVFAMSFESLWANLHWGFHENALAFATLSWAFALIFSGRAFKIRGKIGILILFLLAAACKEILLVDVALALLVWAWSERKTERLFAFKLVMIACALVATFVWFEKLPHPADKNYFARYYSYLGHDLGTFLRTALLSPQVIVTHVGGKELGRYFVTVLFPWLFMPLFALVKNPRKAIWLIALLPSLASAALATYPPLRGAGFHYVLELWPLLAVLTIWTLSRLRSPGWAVAWALLALLCWDRDPWRDLREYGKGAVEQSESRQALARIPPEASVAADELAGPMVSSRTEVTRWPTLIGEDHHCPDWAVVRGEFVTAQAQLMCGGPHLRSVLHVGDWTILGFDRKGP